MDNQDNKFNINLKENRKKLMLTLDILEQKPIMIGVNKNGEIIILLVKKDGNMLMLN